MPGVRVGGRWYVLSVAIAVLLSASCESSQTAALPVSSPTAPFPTRSTDVLVGRYTLALTVELACPIPEAVKSRTYTAQFDPNGDNTDVITLSDAKFLMDQRHPGGGATLYCGSALGCNQFVAVRDGNILQFRLRPTPLGDADNEFFLAGGTIAELIPPDSRLDVSGDGIGGLENNRIDASLDGYVAYAPSMSEPRDSIYCPGNTVRLNFTRQ